MGYKRWAAGAAATALALALAACGSSGESTQTTAADSGPLKTCDGTAVKLQLSFFPNAQYAPLLVAGNRGYWKTDGVNVTLVPGGPNISAAAQISQGLADMALIQFDEVQNANNKGADLVWVGQFYQSSPTDFVALKSTPLSTPADLKGLKVSGETGSLDPELHGVLKLAGLSDSDIKSVPVSPSVQDLIDKKVDVYQVQRFFHIAQLEGMGYKYPDDFNVLDPNTLGVATAPHGLVVRRDFLNEHPDAVACVLAGVVQGVDTVTKDPAGVLSDVEKLQEKGLATPEANKINIQQTQTLMTTRPDGSTVKPLEIDDAFLAKSQDELLDSGVITKKPKLDTFVDSAPLKRAETFVASQPGS